MLGAQSQCVSDVEVQHETVASPLGSVSVSSPVKRITVFRSGDPRFRGVRMAVHGRSFRCFDALLDDLSQKVPLPFGVRTLTTPNGTRSITGLEQLEDGGCYLCSDRHHVKPVDLRAAGKRPAVWQHGAYRKPSRPAEAAPAPQSRQPKRVLLVKNSDPSVRRAVVLSRRSASSLRLFLQDVSQLLQCRVRRLYTPQGHRIDSVESLMQCSGVLVCVGRESFRPPLMENFKKLSDEKLPGMSSRSRSSICSDVHESKKNVNFGLETKKSVIHPRSDSSNRSTRFSLSSEKSYPNGFCLTPGQSVSACPYVKEVAVSDDIEKRVLVNRDGSLSVEMKVRFRLKKDQTLQWSTEIKKSSTKQDGSENLGDYLQAKAESPDFVSASETEEAFAAKLHQKHLDESLCQNCCSHCHEYDIWKNPVHSQRETSGSASSNASSRKVTLKRSSVESLHTVSCSSEEYGERVVEKTSSFVETTEEGGTKVQYCATSRCCSRSNASSPAVVSKSKTSGVSPARLRDSPVSAASASSRLLEAFKEEDDGHDDEYDDLPPSVSRASGWSHSDEQSKHQSCCGQTSQSLLSPRPPSKASSRAPSLRIKMSKVAVASPAEPYTDGSQSVSSSRSHTCHSECSARHKAATEGDDSSSSKIFPTSVVEIARSATSTNSAKRQNAPALVLTKSSRERASSPSSACPEPAEERHSSEKPASARSAASPASVKSTLSDARIKQPNSPSRSCAGPSQMGKNGENNSISNDMSEENVSSVVSVSSASKGSYKSHHNLPQMTVTPLPNEDCRSPEQQEINSASAAVSESSGKCNGCSESSKDPGLAPSPCRLISVVRSSRRATSGTTTISHTSKNSKTSSHHVDRSNIRKQTEGDSESSLSGKSECPAGPLAHTTTAPAVDQPLSPTSTASLSLELADEHASDACDRRSASATRSSSRKAEIEKEREETPRSHAMTPALPVSPELKNNVSNVQSNEESFPNQSSDKAYSCSPQCLKSSRLDLDCEAYRSEVNTVRSTLSKIFQKHSAQDKVNTSHVAIKAPGSSSRALSAADLLREIVGNTRPVTGGSKSVASSRTVDKLTEGKQQTGRKNKPRSSSSTQGDHRDTSSELVPFCLPNASPTEVVNDWLKNIPTDGPVYEMDDDLPTNFPQAQDESAGQKDRSDGPESLIETEGPQEHQAETRTELRRVGPDEKASDLSQTSQLVQTLTERECLEKQCHHSAQVMRVLLGPKLDRSSSLPEVSAVYGRRLSRSAQGLLHCLADLQLIDSDSKHRKYDEVMMLLQSLWLQTPDETLQNDRKQLSLEDEFNPHSSSGVDVGSGSTGSVSGTAEKQEPASERKLQTPSGQEKRDTAAEREGVCGGLDALNAERIQGGPVTPAEAQQSVAAKNESDQTPQTSSGNESYTTKSAELTSSGTPSSVQNAAVSKHVPPEASPVWVLGLLKKLEKQFMVHYADVMSDFKVRWDLDDNEMLNRMISELKEEVHKRIQASINRELQKLQSRAGGEPRAPGNVSSRESSVQTEQRRKRLHVMRDKSVTVSEDGDTASGTDYSDQRSDDEYCPCDACMKKKMASRAVLRAQALNLAPVMKDFDLRTILQMKKDPAKPLQPKIEEQSEVSETCNVDDRSAPDEERGQPSSEKPAEGQSEITEGQAKSTSEK